MVKLKQTMLAVILRETSDSGNLVRERVAGRNIGGATLQEVP